MLFSKRKRHVKRVLIFEDEPLTAFDNEVMIKDAGYEVVATHDDFEEAIAAMEREKIDLVISDVRLRGDKTGLEVAQEALNRGIPVLFATGHPPDNAHELAVGCLVKPYTEKTLRAALDAVDLHITGKPCKPPKGLQLFPPRKDDKSA
jgi:DNA-binding response OmpR family regulator